MCNSAVVTLPIYVYYAPAYVPNETHWVFTSRCIKPRHVVGTQNTSRDVILAYLLMNKGWIGLIVHRARPPPTKLLGLGTCPLFVFCYTVSTGVTGCACSIWKQIGAVINKLSVFQIRAVGTDRGVICSESGRCHDAKAAALATDTSVCRIGDIVGKASLYRCQFGHCWIHRDACCEIVTDMRKSFSTIKLAWHCGI